jgi:hypothetical protein
MVNGVRFIQSKFIAMNEVDAGPDRATGGGGLCTGDSSATAPCTLSLLDT